MKIWIPRNREQLRQHLHDPLFKNAYFLMAGAGSGFVFWLIAARLYSSADIGIASAVISAMRLVAMLSVLGLDIGVIRYLAHEKDKNSMLNTSLTIILLASLLFASVFLAGLDIWSPSLADLLDQGLLIPFIIFAAALSLSGFLGQGVFVALGDTRHSCNIDGYDVRTNTI